ncbi:hypothetical protein DSCA_18070 [Desulfosarcina alkanivorans]|uniref:Damage-control phosphatase ARMT1-like metal-binding domain-containing protein n=2 Tax=Desulfosarcina alkanivorans TaxID=571177 RepID=A0A5K7YTB6_9BACT|nr:hypothetical protein DSCA_18070 [Desulfosarcina alkanivorans]
MDLDQPPPVLGQRLHRRLREISGVADPYRAEKNRLNRMAMGVVSRIEARMRMAQNTLTTAVQLAIAGNVIDLGASASITREDVLRSVDQALAEPLTGDQDRFRQAVGSARQILYLADNAGEIVFDRLLIEALSPDRVTLAVRGAPVINDATMADAQAAGIHRICSVIDNGSDAPGTLLDDCSRVFRQRFMEADLIIAKGQGNFETLSESPYPVFFLFKVKCPVIGAHAGLPVGTHVLARSRAAP